VACGLGFWHYIKGLRRLEKSNAAGVLIFCSVFIAMGIVVSYARGATIAMLIFSCVLLVGLVRYYFSLKSAMRKPLIVVVFVIIFGSFLRVGLVAINTREAWTRLQQGIMEKDVSLEMRRGARIATFDMTKDYWARGAGVGSFRFLFPVYQQHYPSIFKDGEKRLFWEHAHNDLLEIVTEQGIVGVALIGCAVLYFIILSVGACFWRNPMVGPIVLGVVLTCVQAWWDFPFQCPSVLALWWVIVVGAVMWARFECG
jgi:O-antigen ligase